MRVRSRAANRSVTLDDANGEETPAGLGARASTLAKRYIHFTGLALQDITVSTTNRDNAASGSQTIPKQPENRQRQRSAAWDRAQHIGHEKMSCTQTLYGDTGAYVNQPTGRAAPTKESTVSRRTVDDSNSRAQGIQWITAALLYL